MLRLLRAELSRARSRRLTWWVAACLLAFCGALVVQTISLTEPPSAAELAAQQQEFSSHLANWEARHEEWYSRCVESRDASTAPEIDGVDISDCEWINVTPKIEDWDWLPVVPFWELASAHVSQLGPLVAAGALLVGMSLVGAEASTGGLVPWLTFEPRRTRVLVTKVAAAAAVALVLSAGALVVLLGAEVAVAAAHGVLDAPTEPWLLLVAGPARGIALAVAAGVAGAALGALCRSTAGALGAVLGYVIAVELVVWGTLPSLQPWIVRPNVVALLEGGTEVSWTRCGVPTAPGGPRCLDVVYVITTGAGAVYVAGLTVVLVLVTWLVFRRRDVS